MRRKNNLVHIIIPSIFFILPSCPIFPSNPLLVSYSMDAAKINFNPSIHANGTK
jgi:hypothetical protein